MTVRTPHVLLAVLTLALAWTLPAGATTAAAAFCAQGTSSAVEIALGAPDWQPEQTCGPCLLHFCPEVGVRCDFSDCGRNNCCGYTCVCDETCTNPGTPGNTCILAIPEGCSCGNGSIDPGEQCDGSNFGGATCVSLGFDGGTLGCTSACTFNTSGCYKCGNGIAEGPEDCDDPDLRGQTCFSLGFDGGILSCTGTCNFDTSDCYKCGDGVCQAPEDCESCSLDCDSKTTGNPNGRFCCGNGIAEPAEGAGCSVCDGNC